MKSKVALAVAVALALLTAVSIRAYIGKKTDTAGAKRKTVKVLTAAKNLKKGEIVYGDSIGELEVDQRQVSDGRTMLASDAGKILDRKTKVLSNVRKGVFLRWSFFSEESQPEDPARGTPEGFRQVTIPVDKVTGCAGRLLPGTIVDVLVTLRVRRDANSSVEPVTQTVLTGMRIVATDLHARQVHQFLSARERRDFATYSTVTLRVLPLQATLLAFLADQGKLHLVIRGPDDATGMDPSKIDKITLDNLDTLIQKAAREKPPAGATQPRGPRR